VVKLREDIGSALIAVLKRVRAGIKMVRMRRKKPYPEECVFMPITENPNLALRINVISGIQGRINVN
jgi:hypothetical protein